MKRLSRVFLVLDALGLIAFTIIGCGVAQSMGYHPVVVVMAGMITGIAGGILRDVLCNRVPVVFRQELYASVSFAVALLYLGLIKLGVPHDLNVLASFAVGLTIRLAAIWREWRAGVHVPARSALKAANKNHKARRRDSAGFVLLAKQAKPACRNFRPGGGLPKPFTR